MTPRGVLGAIGCREQRWFLEPEREAAERPSGALAGVASDCPWLTGGEEFEEAAEEPTALHALQRAARRPRCSDQVYCVSLAQGIRAVGVELLGESGGDRKLSGDCCRRVAANTPRAILLRCTRSRPPYSCIKVVAYLAPRAPQLAHHVTHSPFASELHLRRRIAIAPRKRRQCLDAALARWRRQLGGQRSARPKRRPGAAPPPSEPETSLWRHQGGARRHARSAE